MATDLRLDCFHRLVPLSFHRWCLDPWCWNDCQRSGVLARYIPLYLVLWDLQILYIPLPE